MNSLIIENVRCFAAEQRVPLAPITVLIGENSTGKSTFLACLNAVSRLSHGDRAVFDEEPFDMGSFDDIAHYSGGRIPKAQDLTIGYEINRPKRPPIAVRANFGRSDAQPVLEKFSISSDKYSLASTGSTLHVKTPRGQLTAPAPFDGMVPNDIATFPPNYIQFALTGKYAASSKPTGRLSKAASQEIGRMLNAVHRARRPTQVIAPVRSRPKRTYNLTSQIDDPEGGHVPILIARASGIPDEWDALLEALETFGKASGLFTHLRVKKYGSSAGGPFQLRIHIAGPYVNLKDVGYGVSQVLPILVDSLTSTPKHLFLMQQPEVHLHPRAQAELATFVASLAKADGRRFIIETHSDYFIDRLRMDVRRGRLRPSDLAFLFFDRDGPRVQVKSLKLDAEGNILKAPDSYRDFFLQEEGRFLGLFE